MSKKNEPRPGERRKPRAPKVSVEGLSAAQEALYDQELLQLSYRMEAFEKLRKDGVLNTPFIALEALSALALGLASGRTQSELDTTWPKEWGTGTITVPLALLSAIQQCWMNYRDAPQGTTLGEEFKIEGGGQGSHPMKTKLAAIDRQMKLARRVEELYLSENVNGTLRLEDAIDRVAEESGAGVQTVKNAHAAHRNQINSGLTDLGILTEVSTSRS